MYTQVDSDYELITSFLKVKWIWESVLQNYWNK